MSTRRIIGPFNRVEGDLEIKVEVDDGIISKAWVNSPLYRGFEQILHGKDPRDALVYTPRICGICSVSQSVAAAQALAQLQGIQSTPNGQVATDLILAAENMADHLTHFYLFFMPDFARKDYLSESWYAKIGERFKAQTGKAANVVLPARAEFLHLTGILAGKWPHSLAIQPGGTTRAIKIQEKIRLMTTITSFRTFLEETMFSDQLENIASLKNETELDSWHNGHFDSDFGQFLSISRSLELEAQGRSHDRFMSFGAYQNDNNSLFKSGVWNTSYQSLDSADIHEDITNSWMNFGTEPKHPFEGSTIPNTDESSGYSWCKAPRLAGEPLEVGAIARQMINGHPLIQDLVKKSGGNVRNRVIARLLELALVVPQMEKWCQQIQINEPFCHTALMPDEARGAGMVEAARGSLGHWVHIKNGRILNYQIIAPTTWNFSPRDRNDQPGALEQALEGTYIGENDASSVTIQHIIRSFDPCMVCTVH